MDKAGIGTLNRTERAFFTLVRAGLWEREVDELQLFPLSDAEWMQVFKLANQQTVGALTFQGACQLPDEFMPNELILQQWLAVVDATERTGRQMNRVLNGLFQLMESHDVHPILLKGQGIAALYLQPLQRNCGDIDLYFPNTADETKALTVMREAGCNPELMADGSYSYTWQGVEIEHHTRLIDIHNPNCQHYIQELIATEGFGKRTPTPMLNLLLLDSHILKHILGHGIGLRQVADMARAYVAFHGNFKAQKFEEICRKTGIYRWTCQLNTFLVDMLGLPVEVLPFEERDAAVMPEVLNKILKGGNFGMHGESRGAEGQSVLQRKWNTLKALLKDSKLSFRLAPKEAFWLFVGLLKGQKGVIS